MQVAQKITVMNIGKKNNKNLTKTHSVKAICVNNQKVTIKMKQRLIKLNKTQFNCIIELCIPTRQNDPFRLLKL